MKKNILLDYSAFSFTLNRTPIMYRLLHDKNLIATGEIRNTSSGEHSYNVRVRKDSKVKNEIIIIIHRLFDIKLKIRTSMDKFNKIINNQYDCQNFCNYIRNLLYKPSLATYVDIKRMHDGKEITW